MKVATLLVMVGIVFVILGFLHFAGVIYFYEYTHGEPYRDGFSGWLSFPSEGTHRGSVWIESTFSSRIGVISAGIPTDFFVKLNITFYEDSQQTETIRMSFRSNEGKVGHLSGTYQVVIPFNTSEGRFTVWSYNNKMTFARPGAYGIRLQSFPLDLDIFSLEEYPNSTIDVADTTVGNQQLYNNSLLGLILVTLGIPWFQMAMTTVIMSRPSEVVVKKLPKQRSPESFIRLRDYRRRRR